MRYRVLIRVRYILTRGRPPAMLGLALAVMSLGGPLVGNTPAAAQPEPSARPNILLIVTDDQRSRTMDVMPSVRRYFEREGITFHNAFATSPLCCPSRASIMTGRYPHNHGVRRNENADALVQETTIQHYLQQAGYRTGIAGKYLNSWDEVVEAPPYFDRWATIDDSNYGHVYTDFVANVNGAVRSPKGYSNDFIEKRTVSFLQDFEAEDADPWFLYVAPFAPHKPFTPERKYRSASTPRWDGSPATAEVDRTDKPSWVQRRFVTLRGARSIARQQHRSLMSVDDMVGDLFEVLGTLDEDRDTLAFFISDNGYMWGEHGLASKRFPYTAATRVPLYVRWPGVLPPGEDDRIVGNIDLAPTMMAVAGLTPDPEEPMDGKSLLGGDARQEILFEYFGSRVGRDVPAWASIRSPSYQYVEYYEPTTGVVQFIEYYDLVLDPFQLTNLLADDDPTNDPPTAVLAIELQQVRDCSGPSCP